jgi:hypothetical protein
MTIEETRNECNKLIADGKGDARVYCYIMTDPQELELNCTEARGLEPFKPFWSTVEGYIIQ